jgi:hypothetical protein
MLHEMTGVPDDVDLFALVDAALEPVAARVDRPDAAAR